MSNKNNFRFEIPGYLIFIGFCIHPALGIILAVLRSVLRNLSVSVKKEIKAGGNPYYHTSMNKQSGNPSSKKNKKKKTSAAYKLLMAGCVIAIALAFLSSLSVPLFSIEFIVSVLPFILAATGFYLGSQAVKKRDVRYARIRALIGNRESINLTKLATASNENLKKIRRDVQKMIDNGEFGDRAYIDLGTNNFMRTPEATPDEPDQFDYRKVYGNVFTKDSEREKASSDDSKKADTKAEDKDDFATILSEIRRLNDEIRDEEVSDRIYKIEAHTKNIFDYVTDHPEAMPQIRTFMNYYLPTTLKLLESYSRIERVGVAGENMKKSKENIESTLDMLVVGFEGQIDQLFRNESIDISSDIAVLETMMQKDGIGGKSKGNIASMLEEYTDEISDDLSGGSAAAAKKE